MKRFSVAYDWHVEWIDQSSTHILNILKFLILVRVSESFASKKFPACNLMTESPKTNLLCFLPIRSILEKKFLTQALTIIKVFEWLIVSAISKNVPYISLKVLAYQLQTPCTSHFHFFWQKSWSLKYWVGCTILWHHKILLLLNKVTHLHFFNFKYEVLIEGRKCQILFAAKYNNLQLNFKLHFKPQDRKNHLNILIIKYQLLNVNN